MLRVSKIYNPFATARPRNTLSIPTNILLNSNLLVGKILDYGCGYGFDTQFLKVKGFNIKGYDKYSEIYNKSCLLIDTYDTIICNYVFNVIDLKEHNELLNKLKQMSNNIYISVRSDNNSIKDNWKYIKSDDYWLTPKGTYQRFYTEEMINKYFGEVKYIKSNNSFRLFRLEV